MPEGNAVYFSAATQQVTWGKWTPKVNSSQCTCLVTRLFPQKRGRRDPGNEANNVPAQAMNFPHGETAAHEFGAWCVSTEDRTAPVWKTPSVSYLPYNSTILLQFPSFATYGCKNEKHWKLCHQSNCSVFKFWLTQLTLLQPDPALTWMNTVLYCIFLTAGGKK